MWSNGTNANVVATQEIHYKFVDPFSVYSKNVEEITERHTTHLSGFPSQTYSRRPSRDQEANEESQIFADGSRYGGAAAIPQATRTMRQYYPST